MESVVKLLFMSHFFLNAWIYSYLLAARFVSKDFKGVFKPHIQKSRFTSHKRLIAAQQQNAVKLNTAEQFMSRNTSRGFPDSHVQLVDFCYFCFPISESHLHVPEIENGITAQW